MLVQERQRQQDCWPLNRSRRDAGLVIEDAFKAGCDSFIQQGFRFGDPEEFLHPPGHPHNYRPDYAQCDGCTPPVHGECILLQSSGGIVSMTKASDIVTVRERSSLRRLTLKDRHLTLKHFPPPDALFLSPAWYQRPGSMLSKVRARVGIRQRTTGTASSTVLRL